MVDESATKTAPSGNTSTDNGTKSQLRYVVTGTGHCGTTYLARVLNCAWENAFRQTLDPSKLNDSWCEVSGMAAAHLRDPRFPRVPVIHLIRDPLKVYRSMYYKDGAEAASFRARQWVNQVLRCQMPARRDEYTVAFIVKWNELIESSPLVTARVDVKDIRQWFENETGMRFVDPTHRVRPHAKKNAPEVDWKDLPRCEWTERLRKMDNRYRSRKRI